LVAGEEEEFEPLTEFSLRHYGELEKLHNDSAEFDGNNNEQLIDTLFSFLCHKGYLVVVGGKLRVPNVQIM
jgi:hypothetical protein